MADTGYKNPVAEGMVYSEWTNPTYAYSSNDQRATGIKVSRDQQDYYNFTFGVPSGATIDGIEVSIEGQSGSSISNGYLDVYLSWDGGDTWTSSKTTGNFKGTSDITLTVGNSTDTWGRTWSDTEFADGTFVIYLFVNTDTSTSVDIDHVKIKVYYTEVSGTNSKINIGDSWKDIDSAKINIGDSWKTISEGKINIGDAWKTIF